MKINIHDFYLFNGKQHRKVKHIFYTRKKYLTKI